MYERILTGCTGPTEKSTPQPGSLIEHHEIVSCDDKSNALCAATLKKSTDKLTGKPVNRGPGI